MKASLQNYSQVNRWSPRGACGSDPDPSPEREALILKYAPLIKYIAHGLAIRLPAHVSVEDLISAGAIGLMDAF